MKKLHISKIAICLMLAFLPSHSAHASNIADFIAWIISQIGSQEYGVVVYAEATAHGKVYVEGDNFTDKTVGGDESAYSQTSSNANDRKEFILNAISATGYEFAGWDESNPATVPYESTQNPYKFEANTSSTPGSGGIVTYRRYAFFKPVQYTISYLKGDHGTGSTSSNQYTIESAPLISQCTFTAESGYIFDKWKVTSSTAGGWTNGDLLSGGQTLSAGRYGNVTLTAQWAVAPTADITISVSGLLEGDSAIFTVAKNNQPYCNVALSGNSSGTPVSTTLKNQETGVSYSVYPTSWSWTYTGDGPGGAWPSHAFNLGNSGYTCSFTAVPQTARNHDEKSVVNFK